MSDYSTNLSVPPLIPGDSTTKDSVVNGRLSALTTLTVPVVTTTTTVLIPCEGMVVITGPTAKLNFYSSGAWHLVTSS